MLVRVQSSEGTKRIQCELSDSTENFIKKIQNEFDLPDIFGFCIYKNRNKTSQIPMVERKTLRDFDVKHGDMVYLEVKNQENTCSMTNNIQHNIQEPISQASTTNSNVIEDEVDLLMKNQKGLIERSPDPNLCHHGENAKCVYCAPIDPYDEGYLKEHNIKHMSFHTYLRKITDGMDKGKFALLENISCKIKPNCKEHAPWPNGICTKCQPNAITLNRQVYRHVDNVMFENPKIVERFLNYWRCTGHQRIGFLYGYYTMHKDVPLGIKATVVAIYEPPQESNRDFVRLLPDHNETIVNYIAERLGIRRVGWIFTDLIPEDIQKGTVRNLRNANTHFLSAQECIMAGYFQNIHPNSCHLSSEGYFGSKFVTVCVTGDQDNQVHMEGYQVSNQCMALVNDNCLLPTKDAPELGYVRESSSEQYVPDVFFKEKDVYGNDVTRPARPLPIEYLLVDVPVSTPIDPQNSFNPIQNLEPFPIENRMIDGHIQDFNALSKYLRQFEPHQFLEAMSDFHLLIYIATMDTLPLKDAMDPLLAAIKSKNKKLAEEWARSDQWATVEQLIMAHGAGQMDQTLPSNNNGAPIQNQPEPWACRFCTFENRGVNEACEMCNLPKNTN